MKSWSEKHTSKETLSIFISALSYLIRSFFRSSSLILAVLCEQCHVWRTRYTAPRYASKGHWIEFGLFGGRDDSRGKRSVCSWYLISWVAFDLSFTVQTEPDREGFLHAYSWRCLNLFSGGKIFFSSLYYTCMYIIVYIYVLVCRDKLIFFVACEFCRDARPVSVRWIFSPFDRSCNFLFVFDGNYWWKY